MSELVMVTRDGDVGVLSINNPPVNALSPGVPEGIVAGVEAFQKDAAVRAIVLIGAGRTFIAGADIKEFGKITAGKKRDDIGLQTLLLTLEDCPKPVVAAIHGTAFGGGLETALACHYRVGVAAAQVGQPEVKLGLIPGAGGTQRLPRLAGVAKAAEMCAGGEPITATDALGHGIVDHIVDGDLLQGAIAFARDLVTRKEAPRRTRELNTKLADRSQNEATLAQVREVAHKRARGLMAPLKAIEAIEAATKLSFAEGIRKEAELFKECLFSDQSKALIHVFFGERAVAKIPGIAKDTPILPIKRAAVVGAGPMGGGIAMTYANAGIPVVLKEISQEALDHGLETIKKNYAQAMKRGRMTQQQMEQNLARIQPTL